MYVYLWKCNAERKWHLDFRPEEAEKDKSVIIVIMSYSGTG